MNSTVADFCRTVRSRSQENMASLRVLSDNELYGAAIGFLRQELDSLLRVAYLYEHDANDPMCQKLMANCVWKGEWNRTRSLGRPVRITDREMVVIASKLGGWVNVIYQFGCRLIHLSNLHDYRSVDPFSNMAPEVEREIVGYLHQHHKYPDVTVDMNRLLPFLPQIMEKLAENVEYYVAEIEKSVSSDSTSPNDASSHVRSGP